MIFSDKIYPRPVAEMLLDGSKCQTRRLVKEGEEILLEKEIETGRNDDADYFAHLKNCVIEAFDFPVVLNKSGKRKWQVGCDYAVQLGGGKPGLWYCPKCKRIEEPLSNAIPPCRCYDCFETNFELLRIVVTGIRPERLLDISEEDAKKEGFKDREEFIEAFYKINKGIPFGGEGLCETGYWNPEVWVLSFSLKGDD